MRTRRLAAAAVTAALIGGCGAGDGGTVGGRDARGRVKVYASDPLPGTNDHVRAYRMALEERDGRAGAFDVELVVRDHTGEDGNFDLDRVRAIARAAAADERVVAYLGEGNSEACAESAPLLNEAGLLQVSATCTYPGLTQEQGAGEGEPDRYRPSGRPTFARTAQNDLVQARAMIAALRREGVRRPVLIETGGLFGAGLARSLRLAADDGGPELLEGQELFGGPPTPEKAEEVLRTAKADAVIFAGTVDPRIVQFEAGILPDVPMFLPDSASDRPFLEAVGEAGKILRVTAPLAGRGAQAEDFARRFKAASGRDLADLRAYASYEAMRSVLDAIERAGEDGDDREAVRAALFSAPERDSLLGRFAFDEHGDTTLEGYGLFRVRDRRLVLEAELGVK